MKARIVLLVVGLAILIISVSYVALFLTNSRQQTTISKSINVACVGDSITQWSGYPTELQNILGEDYNVGNFGVAGAAVSTDWYKPYVNEPAFRDSQDFAPSIVVIMLGTNDAHTYQSESDFADEYENIVTQYQTLDSKPRIILVKPPPIYPNELELNGTNLEKNVIPAIDQVANDLNLTTVDLNNALADHPEYFQDGVHPNSDGATVIATEISQVINIDNSAWVDVSDFSGSS